MLKMKSCSTLWCLMSLLSLVVSFDVSIILVAHPSRTVEGRLPFTASFNASVSDLLETGVVVTDGVVFSVERLNASAYTLWVTPLPLVAAVSVQVRENAVSPWGNTASPTVSVALLSLSSPSSPSTTESPFEVTVSSDLPSFAFSLTTVTVANGEACCLSLDNTRFTVVPLSWGVVRVSVVAFVEGLSSREATLDITLEMI
jgi:hypothetical protein